MIATKRLLLIIALLAPAVPSSADKACEDRAVERANRCHDDCARRFGDPKRGYRKGGDPHRVCKAACDTQLLRDLADCHKK